MLKPFKEAGELLGREKYPSLVLVLPALRELNNELQDATMFDKFAASSDAHTFNPKYVDHALYRAFQRNARRSPVDLVLISSLHRNGPLAQ